MRILALGGLAALVTVGVLALAGVFEDERKPAPTPAIAQDEGAINRIYDRARPSVVFVQARVVSAQRSPFGPQGSEGVSTGTGFVLDEEGHVLTNAHVVENASEVRLRVDEDTLVDAEIVGADVANDLALLKVDPADADLRPLPLGDSAAVDVGDPVLAFGNPLGLEDTITAGIVSAKQRRITAPNGFTIDDVIQTDAAVNPGNSGGPLLDMQGRVIGINSQIATAGSRGFIGIAFAVPVNIAKRVIPDLKDDGQVSRPYLGVTAVTVTPPLAQQLGLQAQQGALVTAVAQGSPAARAGLRGDQAPAGVLTGEGDVIVRIGETEVRSAGDLAGAVGDLEVGARVEIEYVRAGDRRTTDVVLGRPPR